jgi:F0F1-type ATP synthase membrane subunit a
MNQRKRVAAVTEAVTEAVREAVREAVTEAAEAVAYLFLSVMPSVFGLLGGTEFIMRL